MLYMAILSSIFIHNLSRTTAMLLIGLDNLKF